MGYTAADEQFTHQWPRPVDEVHHDDGSWSDRCYFFAHSPDGAQLLTNGFGNNPNQQACAGYGKVALAGGHHRDLLVGRPIRGDRERVGAGPMTWTCVEPLRHWRCDLAPNASGVAWEMHYTPRAPMWELLPMHVEVGGRVLVDMFHMKETGRWTGWYELDGERTSIDGWLGGRDRTFGVRVADELDLWLWLDIGFDDRAIQAWVIEAHDGTVQYVDGGITHTDGTLSKRFVRIDHETTFDGDRKRPARTTLVFTDEDGTAHRVEGVADHQDVDVYYGQPLPSFAFEDLGGGEYLGHFAWDSGDRDELVALESRSMSVDQLMRFEHDGRVGHGIFEILSGGRGPARYLANWPAMDMTAFRQRAKKKEQR